MDVRLVPSTYQRQCVVAVTGLCFYVGISTSPQHAHIDLEIWSSRFELMLDIQLCNIDFTIRCGKGDIASCDRIKVQGSVSSRQRNDISTLNRATDTSIRGDKVNGGGVKYFDINIIIASSKVYNIGNKCAFNSGIGCSKVPAFGLKFTGVYDMSVLGNNVDIIYLWTTFQEVDGSVDGVHTEMLEFFRKTNCDLYSDTGREVDFANIDFENSFPVCNSPLDVRIIIRWKYFGLEISVFFSQEIDPGSWRWDPGDFDTQVVNIVQTDFFWLVSGAIRTFRRKSYTQLQHHYEQKEHKAWPRAISCAASSSLPWTAQSVWSVRNRWRKWCSRLNEGSTHDIKVERYIFGKIKTSSQK